MTTFLIGLGILVVGSILYGKFVEKIFGPDDRATPAMLHNDGNEFVPMSKWKNSLINLLNIAGTGPIFGPIQGILFGPIAFITIPIGCVISGATHDYLCGMVSIRQNGAQMPEIAKKFFGKKMHTIYLIFLCVTLLLVSAVFTYTPGDLLATQILNISGTSIWSWIIYVAILVYYLLATLLPIDKIIGRVYPIFGCVLLLSAVGVFIGIFTKGFKLDDISFSNGLGGIFGLYPLWNASGNSGAGTAFFPAFFVTVACGITSGFHSTQVTLISRSVRSEREGRLIFHWPMILEGFIALVWAAAAMGIYNTGFTGGATGVVGEVARQTLGTVGSLIAILGVIVLPITSGDTALRSCRIMISDFLHVDKNSKKTQLLLAVCLFVPVFGLLVFAKLNAQGFNVIWRYFAWANQLIAVCAFAVLSVYLMAKRGASKYAHLIALLPGAFYMWVVSLFILNGSIGFRIPYIPSFIISGLLTVGYVVLIVRHGRKYAAGHIEE